MEKTIDDGGPAFPTPTEVYDQGTRSATAGLSLRDYFAAKAMQTLLLTGRATVELSDADFMMEISRGSYRMSDAMIASRNKSK